MKNKESKKYQSDGPKAALLLIDVISDFEFEDGEKLSKRTLLMARKLAEFKRRAKEAGVPVIYINDNYGKWQEDFTMTVKHLLQNQKRGSRIAELLQPEKDDYYVLKPKHSAFYSTSLEVLLESLETDILILTGISADVCVLLTASDAYMRGYQIIILKDCVASIEPKEKAYALDYMERVLKARLLSSTEFDFSILRH